MVVQEEPATQVTLDLMALPEPEVKLVTLAMQEEMDIRDLPDVLDLVGSPVFRDLLERPVMLDLLDLLAETPITVVRDTLVIQE